jgi:hypothetical protein
MREIRRLAAAAVGSGVLALGGIAASAGTAGAATGSTNVTGCTARGSLTIGVMPACSSTGTVENPKSITLSVSSGELSALLNPVASAAGQGMRDDWEVSCYAGSREEFTESGRFEVTAAQARTSTTLPKGNGVPATCTVSSTVSTLLAVNARLLMNINVLDISDEVTADQATPGRVGTGRGKCADDKGDSDGNGNQAQIWDCVTDDDAQLWDTSPDRNIVHDGDCLTNQDGQAKLEYCEGWNDQKWDNAGVGKEVVSASGGCLTEASSADGAQLTITGCRNDSHQHWSLP